MGANATLPECSIDKVPKCTQETCQAHEFSEFSEYFGNSEDPGAAFIRQNVNAEHYAVDRDGLPPVFRRFGADARRLLPRNPTVGQRRVVWTLRVPADPGGTALRSSVAKVQRMRHPRVLRILAASEAEPEISVSLDTVNGEMPPSLAPPAREQVSIWQIWDS